MNTTALAVSLLALGVCGVGVAEAQVPPQGPVREAVLRWQMRKYGHMTGMQVWFVREGPGDPNEASLKRLAGAPAPVEKASASVIDYAHGAAKERATGRRGILFSTGGIRWRGPREAVAEGSVFWGPQAAVFCRYTVLYRRGRWTVSQEQVVGQA